MSSFKILHLFNSYLPQSENWAYALLKNTPEVEIHIGARHFLKNNFYDPDFHYIDNYYDELSKVNHKLSKRKPGELVKKLLIKTIPHIFGRYEQTLIRYIETKKIDLIHCHFADVGWQFLEVAQKSGVPLVISFYGWDYEKLPFSKPEYLKRFKILFQKAAAFVCEGPHGAKVLRNLGCPSGKVHIVQLGVQPANIPVHQRRKKEKELKLLQIAPFTAKKGHIYTLKAFSQALKSCPDMQLTLVGNDRDPDTKKQIVKYIETHQLSDKVSILDFVDYSLLYDFLKDYQVFIHPSCYAEDRDCEGGAPIVLLDAQATGMPVIASTHCDIPDEVLHEKTGLLSPEKDVSELAGYIKRFYEMGDEEYHFFAKNARNHIEDRYDISKNAKVLRNVYTKILP